MFSLLLALLIIWLLETRNWHFEDRRFLNRDRTAICLRFLSSTAPFGLSSFRWLIRTSILTLTKSSLMAALFCTYSIFFDFTIYSTLD